MRSTLITIVLGAAALALAACSGPTRAGGPLAQPMSPGVTATTTPAATTAAPGTSGAPGASGSSVPPPPTTTTPPPGGQPQQGGGGGGTPRCVASDIKGAFGPANTAGYSNTMLMSVVATNAGGRTCTINGYGGLELHTAAGATVAVTLTRESSPAPAVVTLKPGAKAYKKLMWVRPRDNRQAATCAQGASSASVTMPDDTRTFTVQGTNTFTICGDLKGYAWSATDLTQE